MEQVSGVRTGSVLRGETSVLGSDGGSGGTAGSWEWNSRVLGLLTEDAISLVNSGSVELISLARFHVCRFVMMV